MLSQQHEEKMLVVPGVAPPAAHGFGRPLPPPITHRAPPAHRAARRVARLAPPGRPPH
jgi:hypothetical protein